MNRLFALLLLLLAQQAGAAVVCRIVSGGGLAFGAYNPMSASPLDSQANIVVTCDRAGGPQNITIDMALDQGTYGTGVATRRMRQASPSGDYLSYGLYRNVGRSSVWGFSAGVDTVQQPLSITNKDSDSTSFIIYGRIPAKRDVRAGIYSDSVQITITP